MTDFSGGSWRSLITGDTVSAIPDSEDFEHNDLTANYGGDTGAFSIQTGTVQEGNYALLGDGGRSNSVIVRDIDQDPWVRVLESHGNNICLK